MRISDWSSDVGSSDLAYDLTDDEALISEVRIPDQVSYWSLILTNELYETTDWNNNQSSLNDVQAVVDSDGVFRAVISARDPGVRSEEHKSELQSLMRSSYAVFCLKKNTKNCMKI